MATDKLEKSVLDAYKDRFPKWTNTVVTGVFSGVAGGYLVVVRSDQAPDSEICFYENGKPYIFESTLELAKDLEARYKTRIDPITGFMLLLGIVVLALFVYIVVTGNKEAVSTLISGFVAILGFFFGTKNAKSQT